MPINYARSRGYHKPGIMDDGTTIIMMEMKAFFFALYNLHQQGTSVLKRNTIIPETTSGDCKLEQKS
jgi:hypothetical protein